MAGAWVLSRVMPRLDRWMLDLSGGRFTAAEWLAGLPVAMVEMTGARSGQPRTAPLIYVQLETEPERMALIATNWGRQRLPAWYHNLKAHPEAYGTVKGLRRMYRAHEASKGEYGPYWRAAVETYPGYESYRKRIVGRPIPIMILDLQGTS